MDTSVPSQFVSIIVSSYAAFSNLYKVILDTIFKR